MCLQSSVLPLYLKDAVLAYLTVVDEMVAEGTNFTDGALLTNKTAYKKFKGERNSAPTNPLKI